MRRLAFLSVVVALAMIAGVKLSPARSGGPSGTLIDALPDGTAVAVIDFQKIARSGLWTTINSQDKLRSEIDKAQSEMGNLGITLSDVHTVAMVFAGASFSTPAIAVEGGFEQNNLLERLRTSGKVTLTSEKYKGIDIFRAKATTTSIRSKDSQSTRAGRTGIASPVKDETSFVFYGASTMVVGSAEAVRASVDVKTGASPGLSQNSQLSQALLQNPAAAIRFALSISPAIASGLKSGDLPVDFSSIKLVFGSIDVGAGIDLNATLRTDTAENAKSVSEKLNALLTMANGLLGSMSDAKLAAIGEALKTVSISNTDTDVRITGNLPMELLDSLLPSTKKGQ